ncbi:3-beta hydroxysteroid dehydrogenase/isomerase family protein [Rhizoctonia solani]|uniref:3-beta hydroxysteroid dehydrogenase/isomerase family protein n=1 Tax=Rhizoctonia solani TaxID=456999 RepID=A0A8H8SV81_9AGAM|nr:3-beta hydroxysteroid dehydrogenase/isomerase family protein [Rhizoctonia solani]QRW19034.1 3-beta hydroxysteroid dehydrogenase/isomerase family protein [Rhizoctonia solani]
MKVAITGASGKVGQGVIQEALEHTNHELRLIDVREPDERIQNPRVEYVAADLRDYHEFESALAGTDALVHLAVGGFKGPPPFESQDVHNSMVVLSFNALQAAANLGMRFVVLVSSINAIGALFSADPKYDYFPLMRGTLTDRKTGTRVSSRSKQILEIQAAAFARRYPHMSISCLRLHFVTPTRPDYSDQIDAEIRKDMWGWTNLRAAGRACILGLEVEWTGAEVFYIVGPQHCANGHSALDLASQFYPDTKVANSMRSDSGFYDCSKAERLLAVLSSTPHTLTLVDHKPPPEDKTISDPRVKYETRDLREYKEYAEVVKGADALIHLAAFAQPYLASPDVVHNSNVTLSFNALQAASEAGIRWVVLASSVNAIGGCYSQERNLKYQYFPVDENHPSFADEPYSISKSIAELQAQAFAGHTLICLSRHYDSTTSSQKRSGEEQCVLPDEATTEELAKRYFPDAVLRKKFGPQDGLFDCSKAERLLGWKHVGGKQPKSANLGSS